MAGIRDLDLMVTRRAVVGPAFGVTFRLARAGTAYSPFSATNVLVNAALFV
jgi:hypothetical protein